MILYNTRTDTYSFQLTDSEDEISSFTVFDQYTTT